LYDDAQSDFESVLKKDPENLRAMGGVGAVYFFKQNYTEAIKQYSSCIDLLPGRDLYFSWRSHILNNLGWAYVYTKKYKKAEEIFNRLKKFHGNQFYAAGYSGAGWASYYLGDFSKADENFMWAISIEPENVSAKTGLKELKKDE